MSFHDGNSEICWNYPWKETSTCLYCLVIIRAADDLVTQGARPSAHMLLTWFAWNMLFPIHVGGVNEMHEVILCEYILISRHDSRSVCACIRDITPLTVDQNIFLMEKNLCIYLQKLCMCSTSITKSNIKCEWVNFFLIRKLEIEINSLWPSDAMS